MKKPTEELYYELYEKLDKANHFDDDFFALSINANHGIAYEIVNRVLKQAGRKGAGKIKLITSEDRQFDNAMPYFKATVFDCLAITEDGRKIAIEIQNRARNFSHRREAFYASRLRVMEYAGKEYDEMMDVYLIIFHSDNPFRFQGINLPLYIKRCYIDGTEYTYDDGINIIRVNGEWKEDDAIGELVKAMHATHPDDTTIQEFKKALSDKGKERIMLERKRKGFIGEAVDEYFRKNEKEISARIREELLPKIRKEVTAEVREELLPKVRKEVTAEVREELVPEVKKEVTAEVKEEARKEAIAEVKEEARKEALAEAREEVRYEIQNSIIDKLLAHGIFVPDDILCAVREDTPIYNSGISAESDRSV